MTTQTFSPPAPTFSTPAPTFSPPLPILEFILTPRSSEDAVAPYWTTLGRLNWRRIFADYGHRAIQSLMDTGEMEGWVEDAYTQWLKRTSRDHLIGQ